MNSTADPGDGTCDDTECTFREAIAATNSSTGLDTIYFDIPGDGVHTITPASELPRVNGPVVIDGYSQPGARANTLTLGSDAILTIELDGSNVGTALTMWGGNSILRGLVINRARSYGLNLRGADNRIGGNFVGTDAGGAADLGNGYAGILTTAGGMAGTVIGGSDPASRNVISGNETVGVSIGGNPAFSPPSGIRIEGNYIGTDASGVTALGNGVGIRVAHGQNIIIGGAEIASGNIIAGNDGTGIDLRNSTTSSNIVRNITAQGNYIGVGADGETPIGNGGRGIDMFGRSGHRIGGYDAGNVIAYNGGLGIRAWVSDVQIVGNTIHDNAQSGVLVTSSSSSGVLISANSFFANGGLGIDLDCSGDPTGNVTPNDPGDADEGPNRCQNTPSVVSSNITDSGGLHIEYVVQTDTSNAAYPLDIEFFAADENGEGRTYIGSDVYTVDDWVGGESGAGGKSVEFEGPGFGVDDVLVLTAADTLGNTSEFSPMHIVGTDADAPTDLPGDLSLGHNYPNPFTSHTTIPFGLPEPADVRVHVVDPLGRRVATLASGYRPAGRYSVEWAPSGFASGIYFVVLDAGRYRDVRQIVVVP